MIRICWALTVAAIFIPLSLNAQSPSTPVAQAEGNSDCWGDDSRQDITCTALTEELLLSLRGKSKHDVQIAMHTKGRDMNMGLRYISMFGKMEKVGSGTVNFTFDNDDHVYIINASLDSPKRISAFTFIWNAYATPPLGQAIDPTTKDFARNPYCSDLSSLENRCLSRGIEDELTRYQMSFGSTLADLRRVLSISCSLAADSKQLCQRLSVMFQ